MKIMNIMMLSLALCILVFAVAADELEGGGRREFRIGDQGGTCGLTAYERDVSLNNQMSKLNSPEEVIAQQKTELSLLGGL